MGRAEKMDSGTNGEVIFTGATTEFQLKKGLTLKTRDSFNHRKGLNYS